MIPTEILYNMIKDTLEFFANNQKVKIPIKQFYKQFEKKYNLPKPLSLSGKHQIYSEIRKTPNMRIITTKNGTKYVLIGNLN